MFLFGINLLILDYRRGWASKILSLAEMELLHCEVRFQWCEEHHFVILAQTIPLISLA